MFTRMTTLVVLLAALLQAAPVTQRAVPAGSTAYIVSVRSEHQNERKLRQNSRQAGTRSVILCSPQAVSEAFAGFSNQHFQRPPPVRS